MKERLSDGAIIVIKELERLKQNGITTSKHSLAKRLFKQHPDVFASAERVRGFINHYTGKNGNKRRVTCTIQSLYDEGGNAPERLKQFPKVLLFDLETSPMLSYHWDMYDQNINPNFVVHDWFLLTWSAKWLLKGKMYHDKLTPAECLAHDDSRIVKSLWQMIDEADVIIAHNLKKFDEKKMKNRFLINGLMPPSPYQTIDTYLQVRNNFPFSSNKLDYINMRLGISRKIETDYTLWLDCMKGKARAFSDMQKYNDGDVMCLEELYLIIRPYIKSHPNIGLFFDDGKLASRCSACGEELTGSNSMDKPYRTQVGVFSTYRCPRCGAISRGRTSDITKDMKKYLNISIAR